MHLLCLIFSISFQLVSSGNVLIINPLTGHSHVRFLGNIADLLANDGHNVTMLSLVLDPRLPPFETTHPGIHKILFKSSYLKENVMDDAEFVKDTFWHTPETEGMAITWTDWDAFTSSMKSVYQGLLENKETIQKLKDSHFDLGICEIYEMGGMGLFEVLNIKTAMVATAIGMIDYHYSITGIPYFTSFIPKWMTTFGEKMTIWERLINIKSHFEYLRINQRDLKEFTDLFRSFTPEIPDLLEVAKKKTGVIISNTNEFTESPRLRSNMIQYVGGTNVHPAKELDEEIISILEKKSKSVYFSFGTIANACHIPVNLKKEILSAFEEFPDVTFLWKHGECENEEERLFPKNSNVIRRKWWPQSDLLADSRVKAFITHAGMNSITEAAFRGIPMITVPLFGDQYLNTKAAENRGLSIMIKRTELGKSSLVSALKQILAEHSTFSRNAAVAKAVLNGKDEEYRESLLRWANLLIEFGPLEHLRLPSRNLHFIQLFSLDILLLALSLASFVLFVVYVILCRLYRLIVGEKMKKE